MSKSNKVYNKQYKEINQVEARITKTDNNHTNLQNAHFMLDVRFPIKNRKITLADVVDMMEKGFQIIRNDINSINLRIDNLVSKNNLIE